MLTRECLTVAVLVSLLTCNILVLSDAECELKFVSRPENPQNGTFTAPTLDNASNFSIICVYIFIAAPHQRVQITFDNFDLRGTPPECLHEYLDIYTEIRSTDKIELTAVPFDGRYCGTIPPRSRISLYRTLAFSFYTDKRSTYPAVFSGQYAFINDTAYEVGTPAPNTPCTFTIIAVDDRKGVIVSPTYPGAYPKPLFCSFLFTGKVGQRIHLEFRDFDLFSGGTHCPFDVVTVYDGRNASAPLIGTYCGQHRNLFIYSTKENLYVTFSVIERATNTQNRGFKGFYEFSESFVKLDFIGKNGGEHIKGTECDQKILSKRETSGFVFSPNYPFPYIQKTVCRYFIYGLQDSQDLERVKLEFSMFDIPKGDDKEECNDRYLKIYLKGQETIDAYDKFDYEYCGNDIPPPVVSDGPRLVLIFASGESQGRGFKAKYTFETEYLVPGTPAPGGVCGFTYRGIGTRKQGDFNSPRYPANYPSMTNCSYTFYQMPNEQVMIIFDQFKMRTDRADPTMPQFGDEVCQEDWIEIYNIYRDNTENRIGRYCGFTSPGPIESVVGAAGIRINFHTDEKGVYSGFKAKYVFEHMKSVFGECGGNISHAEDGVIQSPGFPNKYSGPSDGTTTKTCNWYITVKPAYKVFLNVTNLVMEGSPASRGCSAAVLRLWLNVSQGPIELCGEEDGNTTRLYLSETNRIRLSFVVSDKSAGAQGFQLNWTEVALSPNVCNGFQCARSGLCIPEKLQCNNVTNCGENDVSDEFGCKSGVTDSRNDALLKTIVVITCIGGIILLLICLVCQTKRKKRRQIIRPPPSLRSYSGSQRVQDSIGQRFASIDSV